MIVVTGAAGFIGSCLVSRLNKEGFNDLILVDDFSKLEKENNLIAKKFAIKVERADFAKWFQQNTTKITFVFHIGARTDTTEFNRQILTELNYNYTVSLWKLCETHKVPFVYASSAATYGLGELGYDDTNEEAVYQLKPLNAYGDSKNEFDKWALKQEKKPAYWVGLKFFNVYGPNEYHKGRMASVIFHAYRQINQQGKIKLFRSHNPQYKDGEQLRDFIYVKDVINVCLFLYKNKVPNGLYNLGTGKARSFLDLARNTFKALQKPENIDFIDTPADIRDKYQYFTEAKMNKLVSAGYTEKFHTLEEGVKDYVQNYLEHDRYY